jgi:hypothetical protein
MKSKLLIGLTLALVLVLTTVSLVSAKTERKDFTYYSDCDWSTVDIQRIIENGQANILWKHFTQACNIVDPSIDEVVGVEYIDISLNMVGIGIWKYTGKAQIIRDGSVIWDMNCVYPWPSELARCVGQGQGIYEGYQIFKVGGGDDMKWTGAITYNQ